MNMEQSIKRIKTKLADLKVKDNQNAVFGAQFHKYQLSAMLKEADIAAFEKRFNIELPSDYKLFLLLMGNGGAGPYYGIQPLEDSLFEELNYKDKSELINPALPCVFSEAWNMTVDESVYNDEKQYSAFIYEYYNKKWVRGMLRICDMGALATANLVVNGNEYGNIWIDDRGEENGIYPFQLAGKQDRVSFIEWYEHWLDCSLEKYVEM